MKLRMLLALATLVVLAGSRPLTAQQPGRPIPEVTFVVPAATYDPVRFESGVLISDNWRRLGCL